MKANGWTVSLLEVGILPMEAADLAPEGVLSSPVRTPVNAVLLRGHGRTILVDAGSGPSSPAGLERRTSSRRGSMPMPMAPRRT